MNKQILSNILLTCGLLLAGLLFVSRVFGPDAPASSQSTAFVNQFAVFTLQGCGSCSDAMNAMREFEAEESVYEISCFDIAEDEDQVNQHGVTEHPTVLFLNEAGEELGRIEKSVDLEAMRIKLEQLADGTAVPVTRRVAADEADSSMLTTLYVTNPASGKLVAVSQYVNQQTSVKYPRINALRSLFSIREQLPEALESPIPETADFVEIRTEGEDTVVELSESFASVADSEEGRLALEAIALTLGAFQVEQLRIEAGGYSEENIRPNELAGLVDGNLSYTVEKADHHPPAKGIEQYNTAILHSSELAYMPCYCGCGNVGHTSNLNCYFEKLPDGTLRRTDHAEYCQVCLDITDVFKEQRLRHTGLTAIRDMIDRQYRGSKSTDTPLPPE